MIEIAICLAIIGIALVAIVGVLPLGMSVQRENREGTIINQDATVLLEAVRTGARGMDDLTNYVYAVTNYWTLFRPTMATRIQKLMATVIPDRQSPKLRRPRIFP